MREHRRVGFDAGVVLGDRTAGGAHRFGIVARQVGADLRPALSFVGRLPDVLRADVDGPGSVGAITIGNVHWNRSAMSAERIAHRVVRIRIDLRAPGRSADRAW